MSLIEILSDAVKYPFSDIKNYLIVGVLAVLASLANVLQTSGIQNSAVLGIAGIIAIIFTFIFSGYGIDVIKKAIESSSEFPAIDLKRNLINGIKAFIIGLVYLIIPIIIAVLLMGVSGIFGAGINHLAASLSFASIIVFIVFLLFGIFTVVALARFADTEDFGAALNVGAVIEDAKKIGILKIIVFVILVMIISVIISFILGIFAVIPYIGVIIATLLANAFAALFASRALGLLYARA